MVLVGYWPLNETSGTTAYDVRNGNDGTVNGAGPDGTGTSSGLLNSSAYSFDGTDDYVTMPRSREGFPKSYSVWFNPGDGSGYPAVLRDDYHTQDAYSGISIQYNAPDTWALQIGDGSGSGSSHRKSHKGGDLTLGNWHHLVAVARGVNDVELYKNGVNDYKGVSGSGSSVQYIGSKNVMGFRPAGSYYTPGKIQHVRIYDHALTPQEVQYMYSVGKNRGLHISSEKTL
ncbi:LamG domain-containing protein [Candidatus Nanosalina sp. VS9-1]|uniref:LamG domain-containing protein n=1 Tax=Candidatus Nanosalina sp. VS9-1 TaxID=3388566 RepID=UPI0039DF55BC